MKAHENQYRHDGIIPYITHPESVYNLLKEIGIENNNTLCAAWLHDTIEDCELTKEYIEYEFNSNIANLVAQLTKNCGREKYLERIKEADYDVQIIKLADIVHNCSTLNEAMPKKIKHKVEDCKELYFELSEKICPKFHYKLQKYLEPWL
ncbi:MAG: HD domain-containing protein [Candidatus Aenigmarchaeota archaeon]|nr:HD domain-containing protein [Candidatus Aenigmarchaeota archaeon]